MRLVLAVTVTCAALTACGGGTASDEVPAGDCAARLGYDGAVFDPLGRPPQGAGTGRADTADVLECDGTPIDTVDVRRLPGRGEAELLVVRTGDYRGTYLREGVAPSPVPVPPSPSSTG